jgi:DNA-binding MarR family transcriptional regulator
MTTREEPAHRIQMAMTQIARWVGRPETRAKLLGAAGQELSPIDVELLRTIVANGPVRVSDLAEWQCVDKSTITPQVRRLERRELIERRPDPADRRAVLLTATARGRRTCQRMEVTGAAVTSSVLQGWSQEDQEAFATLFSRFARDLTT